jgi:hypothetical protein
MNDTVYLVSYKGFSNYSVRLAFIMNKNFLLNNISTLVAIVLA